MRILHSIIVTIFSILYFNEEQLLSSALSSAASSTVTPVVAHDGWRIALNIGREKDTRGMPESWAESGCRMPVVIKCDFILHDKKKKEKLVVPKDGSVRFTGPEGEITNPVETGSWSLTDERNLSFTLNFPNELKRRDVTLQGMVKCEGLIYSEESLKKMNKEFYSARQEKWNAGEAYEDIERRKEAPKKWNDETDQWEERYKEEESLTSKLKKRAALAFAERNEKKVNNVRPNPKDLSLDCGPFPTVEGKGKVYVLQEGKVILEKGGLLNSKITIGTWSAEPINNKPVSYY